MEAYVRSAAEATDDWAISGSGATIVLYGADAAARETLQRAARWNAKSPQLEFAADTQRKQREASEQLRAANERWAAPAYRALERLRHAQRAASGAGDHAAQSPKCPT